MRVVKTSKTKSGCNMNKLILEDKLCYISNLTDKCFAFYKNSSIDKLDCVSKTSKR